jgi:Tfp pilus assembly protein PilZ
LTEKETLRRVFEQELRHGGLFVPTITPPAAHTIVTVTLLLPEPKGELQATGEVVYVSQNPAGIGVQLTDAAAIKAALLEALDS